MSSDTFEVIIIGAGVIGLAVAAELAVRHRQVLVVEKNRASGQETSSRNSEVLHAGIYYPSNLFKSSLCVTGNRLLYEFCAKQGVPHLRAGKIIVATFASELESLEELKQQGESNGIDDLRIIGEKEIRKIEPEVQAMAGLFSPSTGIINSHRFMECLFRIAERHNALLAFRAEVTAISCHGRMYNLDINRGEYSIQTKILVNCAGLYADRMAALAGIDIDRRGYRLRHCKGNYFVSSPSPGLRHLVYPVPHKNSEFLGIHATPDLGGKVRFGPDILYLDDSPALDGVPPSRDFDYSVDESRKTDFFSAITKYLPGIKMEMLHPDMSGIRPKLQGPGEPLRDFVIREEGHSGFPGLINLIGIESPGLTCSLSIARFVSSLVDEAA
jgi:L-2-hydroxyglutarate oxidase LhgO